MADWVHREAHKNGMTIAEFQKRHFTTNESTSLFGGFAETDEVANLIVYLCCPASNATRGAVLRAEGGATRTDWAGRRTVTPSAGQRQPQPSHSGLKQ